MKKLSIFANEFKNSGLWCNGNTTDSGPVFLGSSPGSPTNCPDGGIGRRAGLKHQWSNIHPGSTPGLGTKKKAK